MTDVPMNSLTLGKRIQRLRKGRDLTQESLAEQLSLTAQAVSKWENDLSCPDIMTLPTLARLLNVTVDTLLTGASSPAAAPAKPKEDLILRIAYVPLQDGELGRIGVNLPYRVVRLGARYGLATLTVNTSDDGSERLMQHFDLERLVDLVESGVTGKLLDVQDDDFRLTIWTE